jgi:hypothetical protein
LQDFLYLGDALLIGWIDLVVTVPAYLIKTSVLFKSSLWRNPACGDSAKIAARLDMDDQKIVELKKLRAEVKAKLDKLDASIRLLRNSLEHRGKGRHYSAAARKRMSNAAKQRQIDKRKS